MDKHNNFHYLFRKRRGVESPSLKLSDSVYIPKNSSEIIMSSLKNLDMEQLLKHDIIQKMNSDQTNDFHFYDIPVFVPKEESNTKEKLKKKQEFKSIHNNVDLLQHKTFSSKIIEKPKYTDIEKNVRNALKKDGSLMMLNEMFFELDQKEERVTKKINQNSLIHMNTDPEIQSETNLIFNLDKWLKKAKFYQENRSNLSYLPKIQRKNQNTESEMQKKELMEEHILKKYNIEEEKNLKMKVRKKEDYELQAFLKKMPQINKISTVFFENEDKKTDETNELFIEHLKKNVKSLLRADVSKSDVSETAQFFEKHVDKLLDKIDHKIKNIDAIIVTKETTMQLIRKENLNIIKRINKIKQMRSSFLIILEENPSNYFLGKDYGKINKAKQEKGLTKSIMDISYKKERDDMKKQCDELKQNLKAFEIKLNYNNEMIYQIEPTKKKNKNELRQIIKLKKKFLLKLLKLGKDFRNEGLVWLIKKCLSNGEKIDENNLPDFLDTKAKEFLLQRAKYEQNIKECELFSKLSVEILQENVIDANLQQTNINLSKSNGDSTFGDKAPQENEGSVFLTKLTNFTDKKTVNSGIFIEDGNNSNSILPNQNSKRNFDCKVKDMIYKRLKNREQISSKQSISNLIYDETKEKIKELIRPNYEEENPHEKTHFEDLSTLTFDVNYSEKFTQNVLLYENESQCHFHDNKNGFLKDMENMNKKVMETQKIIQKLENSEVYRIIKEFDYRNYSQRFQTDVETVLSSLIGVKKALKEVSKYGMSTKQ